MRTPRPLDRVATALLVLALAGCGGGGDDGPTGGEQQGDDCHGVTGPTIHAASGREDLEQDATWTKCASPHVVKGLVNVSNRGNSAVPSILTIEPGARVEFDATIASAAMIRVGYQGGGGLVALGTPTDTIVFTSTAASPVRGDWEAIVFHNGTTKAQLAWATVEYCGGPINLATGFDGCIVAQGDGPGAESALSLQHVRVRQSASRGIVVGDGARFASGGTAVTVTDGASYPIAVDADAASTLPSALTLRDNDTSGVVFLGTEVATTQGWPNPGNAFVAPVGVTVRGNASPTLTLAPGTTIRMGANSLFRVGVNLPGTLLAQGTAAAPITFTADTPDPHPAFWRMLELGSLTTAATRLDHVIVEYAGGFDGYVPGDSANVLVGPNLGAFISNSTFRFSGGCGITIARYKRDDPPYLIDFTSGYGNSFTGNAMAAQCGPYD